MATISRANTRKLKFLSSIKFKFAATYIALIVVVLVLMNTYFLTASRDMIFASKQSSLQNQVAVIATTLASLDSLSTDDVRQTMGLLDVPGLTKIIVTDTEGVKYYNTTDRNDDESNKYFAAYYDKAIAGNDVFYSCFSNGVFASSAFSPILNHGVTTGMVFILEYDEEQGAILLGLQNTLKNISIIITTFAILILVFVLRTVISRITVILSAIKSVREGEYNYHIELDGSDELAQLSDEFNSLTNRLQQTEEIRQRFVADASHELKTPLASIRLLSDSILQNEEIDPDMVREFVTDISSESERLTRTTEKLLSLTKLDSKIVSERVPVDMRDVASATLRMLRPLAEKNGLTLNSSLDGGCTILASESDIHQVMFNLVENAIKYNKPGGSVTVTLLREEQTAVLNVDDTGIGVPLSDIPHIFDRFYRVDKARSREAGGSGLGLSIVRTTVHEYGGTIEAERRQGGGMRFQTTFPLYISDIPETD